MKPRLLGLVTRFLYAGKRVKFGKRLRVDSVPRIIVNKGCEITFGDKIELRRNVEIRCHGNAQITIGSHVRIDRGVRILATNNAKISLAEGVRIGLYSVLNGGDSISIGTQCLISGFVYIQTSMHGYANKSISVRDQGYSHAPVVLSNDVWLGTHVVIHPGVTLDTGVVVGSNAVVTKNIQAHKVVAGVPAKLIKQRN